MVDIEDNYGNLCKMQDNKSLKPTHSPETFFALIEFDDILNHQMIARQLVKMHVICTHICSRGIALLHIYIFGC